LRVITDNFAKFLKESAFGRVASSLRQQKGNLYYEIRGYLLNDEDAP